MIGTPRLFINNKDLLTGAAIALFGAGSLVMSSSYRAGTAANMGPGYFPSMIGWLILILGLIIAGKGLRTPAGEIARIGVRPLLFVFAGIAVFGLFVDKIGLFLAAPLLVAIARIGGHDARRYIEVAVVAALATTGAAAVFIFGLGVPIPLLPR